MRIERLHGVLHRRGNFDAGGTDSLHETSQWDGLLRDILIDSPQRLWVRFWPRR